MKNLGVIGIVVKGDRDVSVEVQSILTEYGDLIVGRMGVPRNDENISVISVIIEGTPEEITGLTARLDNLPKVSVKYAVTQI